MLGNRRLLSLLATNTRNAMCKQRINAVTMVQSKQTFSTNSILKRSQDTIPRVISDYDGNYRVDDIALNTLRDNFGSKQKKIRLGRGTGSGRGKTSGKGHKGQKARRAVHIPRNFEGGQTPLARRLPKFGFSNKMFERKFEVVSLGKIQYFIDTERIDISNGGTITMKTLQDSGLVRKIRYPGIKIVASGHEMFTSAIKIDVPSITPSSVKVIEDRGGKVVCSYWSRLALNAHMRAEKYLKKHPKLPARGMPPPKLFQYYQRTDIRGYLADTNPVKDNVDDTQQLLERYREQKEKMGQEFYNQA